MMKIGLTTIVIFLCLIGKSQYNREIKIETLLKTDTTSIGQRILYPNFKDDEVTISKITIPPGKSTGWHKHEVPVFAYVLQGTLTVEVENHKTLRFSEHSYFAEVINTFHNGTNREKEDVVLIAYYLGGKGEKLSVMKETGNEK